ncbi:MAG: hypothetical protein FD152_2980 [Xanthobacteraceae bacterium]|nr:MAG: hypothetical protein FD152_2980 [Xanthobacteraceae bacterium]
MLEDDVDVDGLALDRPLVGKHLHAVDELHDPVGLVADQPRQSPILVVNGGFEQLCRASDARERVLDFVGQHRRQRRHRPCRPAVGELAVHLVGNCAFLEHHHDVAGPLGQRRDVYVDDPFVPVAGRAEIDLVFVDRCVAFADLVDEGHQRAAEGNQFLQHVTTQNRDGGLEEAFRCRIAVDDHAVGGNAHDWMGQCVEDGVVAVETRGCGDHAAALHWNWS